MTAVSKQTIDELESPNLFIIHSKLRYLPHRKIQVLQRLRKPLGTKPPVFIMHIVILGNGISGVTCARGSHEIARYHTL